MAAGIEAIDFYGGRAFLDIRALFEYRGLDLRRFDNLMLRRKSVALPCEDPVSFAVNAAKPMLDRLSAAEKDRIELLITATESGLDFGKSLSTYVHHHLGLGRACRMFEVKQACYGGTAALQTALGFVASNASPGAKALIVATDIAKAAIKGSYIEPSQGAGAVAMLVSDHPDILEVDFGASGYHGYEVMDSCRPTPELETGDSDLSLIAYLDCLEHSFLAYASKVEGADFVETFDYLAFHTPFPGMVKGAHRMLMRKLKKGSPVVTDEDFNRRVAPSLAYCVEVGNIYSATLYLALCGVIDTAALNEPRRVGLYSYGSGCCAEFFSGIVTPQSKARLTPLRKQETLAQRQELTMKEYDRLLDLGLEWPFGIKDKTVDVAPYQAIYDRAFAGRGLLVLKQVKDYHREYQWS
ncbi:MAG: hydroxymethylglutaryl-CoA synthase family protein [Limisphaerales bacterium]